MWLGSERWLVGGAAALGALAGVSLALARTAPVDEQGATLLRAPAVKARALDEAGPGVAAEPSEVVEPSWSQVSGKEQELDVVLVDPWAASSQPAEGSATSPALLAEQPGTWAHPLTEIVDPWPVEGKSWAPITEIIDPWSGSASP